MLDTTRSAASTARASVGGWEGVGVSASWLGDEVRISSWDEGMAGCADLDRVADRLQLSVLDAVMRASYSLASAAGSGGERGSAKLAEAIEQLDGVSRELLDLIVELRVLGGR
jgi:hypothetical protein